MEQDFFAAALPPLRPASFFCAVVPPCFESPPEPLLFPPCSDDFGLFAIFAARSLDMPLSASYCFSSEIAPVAIPIWYPESVAIMPVSLPIGGGIQRVDDGEHEGGRRAHQTSPDRILPVLRGVRPGRADRPGRAADEAGFESLWISDHFHPWNEEQGQSPLVWSMIGAIAS